MLICFFLSLALSADAFATAVSFGADGIRIPRGVCLLTGGICGGLLWLSLLAGRLAMPVLPASVGRYAFFVVLLLLGLLKMVGGREKPAPPKPRKKQLQLRILRLRLVLQIYLIPQAADQDGSRSLSAGEAAWLAVALSLDSLACGLAAEIPLCLHPFAAGCTVLATLCALLAGGRLGALLGRICGSRIQWLGGLILVLLAFTRL